MWWIALALGAPLDDGLYTGTGGERANGTVTAVDSGESVTLFRRFDVVGKPVVFAIANDNSRYRFWAQAPRGFQTRWPYAHLGGHTYAASSVGRDGHRSTISFDVDTAVAKKLADQHGVSLLPRTALGTQLQARFEAGAWTVGEPQSLTLVVLNKGAPVDVVVGGRQRGPRNNRFAFTVRDGQGKPLEGIIAHDFGGLSTSVTLQPGDEHRFEVDVASWASIDKAGTYSVECTFEGELWQPDAYLNRWPDRPHETWDWVASETIEVRVGE